MLGLAPKGNGKYDYDVPVGGCITAPSAPKYEFTDSTGRVFCGTGDIGRSSIDTEFFDDSLNKVAYVPIKVNGSTPGMSCVLQLTADEAILILGNDAGQTYGQTYCRKINANNIYNIDSLQGGGGQIQPLRLIYDSFTGGSSIQHGYLSCAVYINNTIIIGTSTGKISYSTNLGVTWSNPIVVGTTRVNDIFYCNSKYIAILASTGTSNTSTDYEPGKLYYSSTLTGWTLATTGIGNQVSGVEGINKFITYNYGDQIAYSADMGSWTVVGTLPNRRIFDSVKFDSKIFLCGGNNFLYVSSDDGVTWTNINSLTPVDANSAYIQMFEYGEKLYICQSDNGLTSRIFSISKGSNSLSQLTIAGELVKTIPSNAMTTAIYSRYYSKLTRNTISNNAKMNTYTCFYISESGDLIANLLNSNNIHYKLTASGFEKVLVTPHSKYVREKICTGVYLLHLASYSISGYSDKNSNRAFYSSLNPGYYVPTLPTGYTHLRTK